jgi:hypothetical protein
MQRVKEQPWTYCLSTALEYLLLSRQVVEVRAK